MTVEAHRLAERAQRRHGATELARVLHRVGDGARRRPGALEVEVDAVAQGLDQTRPDPLRLRPRALVPVARRRLGVGGAGAVPVGHRGEDRVAADPIGHGVVQLEEQRRAIAGQPVVDARLPQRPAAVERRLVGGTDLAQQLRPLAARHRVVPQVVVDVEGGIVLPVRQGQVQRRVAHALRQTRNGGDTALEGGAQTPRIGRAIEQHEHSHGGRLLGGVQPPEREILAVQAFAVLIHCPPLARAVASNGPERNSASIRPGPCRASQGCETAAGLSAVPRKSGDARRIGGP